VPSHAVRIDASRAGIRKVRGRISFVARTKSANRPICLFESGSRLLLGHVPVAFFHTCARAFTKPLT
jgi:hypothetical protein